MEIKLLTCVQIMGYEKAMKKIVNILETNENLWDTVNRINGIS